MYGAGTYGQNAYGARSNTGILKQILVETLSLSVNSVEVISLVISQTFSLLSSLTTIYIRNIVLLETMVFSDYIVRTLNGIIISIWSKVEKLSATWSKVASESITWNSTSKSTASWTKQEKKSSPSGYVPADDEGFVEG